MFLQTKKGDYDSVLNKVGGKMNWSLLKERNVQSEEK